MPSTEVELGLTVDYLSKTFCGKDQKYVKERKLIEKDTK